MKILDEIATTLILFFLISLSVYTIWGWLTVQDIRTYCAKEGLDAEKVLYLLAQECFIASDKATGGEVDSANILLSESVKIPPSISRLNIMHTFKIKNSTKDSKINPAETELTIVITPFEPFLTTSENVNNTICCLGIGYMVGMLVVGAEFIRGIKISSKRLIFRPLVGALASGLLLIVIISGGSVIWNEVAGVKGLSLGMIGVIGSLFCEKIKPLLTTGV